MDKIKPLIPLSAGMFSPSIIAKLLEAGANIKGKGKKNRTALHAVCHVIGKFSQEEKPHFV